MDDAQEVTPVAFFNTNAEALVGSGTIRDFSPQYDKPDPENIADGMEPRAVGTPSPVSASGDSGGGEAEPDAAGPDSAATDPEGSTKEILVPPA